MDKVWLKSYQAGTPTEININEFESIVDLFEKSFKRFSKLAAFENFGTSMTYREIERKSRHFASYLQNVLKLKKGDRVAIMMPNIMQYPVALFGILRAGLVVVNINPLYTVDELTFQLNDAAVETIIVTENAAATVAEALPNTTLKQVIVTKIGDLLGFPKSTMINVALKYIKKMIPKWSIKNVITFKKVIKEGSQLPFTPVPLTHQDIAFLQYTGGTTGVAKGAILSHGNIIANVLQAEAGMKPNITTGKETAILPLPLYHIYALVCSLFLFNLGVKTILITNPRDISSFIKTLKKTRFTVIFGINTLFNALMNNPHFVEINFSPLKLSVAGGMATQSKVADKWQEITHDVLIEGYGLTETSPVVTFNPVTIKKFNGSVGLPVPSTDIKILDENDKEVGFNEPGELCVHGPQVMQGYWKRPDETAKTLSPDGWLKTGDVATIDEAGFVRIVDRKKDMIDISGFKVYPNQIEDVIAKLPGVLEVGVAGHRTADGEEHVRAYIVKRDPQLTEKDVIDYCRNHLTKYKIPKEIVFVNDLPKSPVGKVLRRQLLVKD